MTSREFIESQGVSFKLAKSAKAKRLSLSFKNGCFRLTYPARASEKTALDFFNLNLMWVRKVVEKYKQSICLGDGKHKTFLLNKLIAHRKAKELIARYSPQLGVKPAKILIRNQSSRWGSCSKQANISLNYRIALLPERLAEYIVVHELCHIKEFNHSARFWKLVSGIFPDHKVLRQELKKYRL